MFDGGATAPGVRAPEGAEAPSIDSILGGSGAAVATPPPTSRRARRQAARIDRAATSAASKATASAGVSARRIARGGAPRSGGNSQVVRMFAWGLLGMLALGALALMSGAIQLGPPGSSPTDLVGGSDRDGSWSYYHDRDYDTRAEAAKWSSDRTRSTDPDEAVLGDTSRWEYEGPYRYGPYGSDAIRKRGNGSATRDPLYSQVPATQDVFSQYGGDLDPSGGEPVGVAPSNMTNPYYDPYAGYSNPYANRIRLSYGEGVGRGAATDFGG